MSSTPVQPLPPRNDALIVLVGITANRADRSRLLRYFRTHTPYSVFVPTLCQYFGIRFAARRLCRFLKKPELSAFSRYHVVCYISGGFILRAAANRCRLPVLGRIVYIRSPIQECVPKRVIERYGTLIAACLHGKMLFDLAADWKDDLPRIEADDGYVIEQGVSSLAARLGLQARPFSPNPTSETLPIPSTSPVLLTPLSHDAIYSNDRLLAQIAGFLKTGRFDDALNAHLTAETTQ